MAILTNSRMDPQMTQEFSYITPRNRKFFKFSMWKLFLSLWNTKFSSPSRLNKLAGVLLLGTSGAIPPMKTEKMETVCQIKEKKTIHPFAYRTHTHSLGKVVSGWSVRSDQNDENQWTLLGKRDPLTPQMFYPVINQTPIKEGDFLAARCTMVSNRHSYTYIGATNEDEMCNFYLMYYVENDEPLDMKYCFSAGPPFFYWRNPEVHLNNIPDTEASTL